MAKLTEKQKRFVEEYLIDLNATQAAIRAGYSKKTATEQGARLLTNVKVQSEIEKRQQALQATTQVTQERVIQELANIGFYDINDYAKVEQPADLEKVDVNKRKALTGMKWTNTGFELKLGDKIKALELLGKHLGLFTEQMNITTNQGDGLLEAIENTSNLFDEEDLMQKEEE